jgi:hypothetical protein
MYIEYAIVNDNPVPVKIEAYNDVFNEYQVVDIDQAIYKPKMLEYFVKPEFIYSQF